MGGGVKENLTIKGHQDRTLVKELLNFAVNMLLITQVSQEEEERNEKCVIGNCGWSHCS